MNQVFDFKRWLLLVGKHWSENRKRYLLSLVALASLMIIWFSFVFLLEFNTPYPEEMQLTTYYVGMAIVGCLYGSLLFSDLASGPKGMHYLSVPASAAEKLLNALFYGLVLFTVCYTAIFYLVDLIMVNVANGILENYWNEHSPAHEWTRMSVVNVFVMPKSETQDVPNMYYYFMVMYLNLSSAFILGSIYFPKYSFIKTCILLFALFLLMVFYLGDFLDGYMPQPGSWYEGMFAYRVMVNGDVSKVAKLPDALASFFKFLFMYGFMPLLWFTAYARLKEKEV